MELRAKSRELTAPGGHWTPARAAGILMLMWMLPLLGSCSGGGGTDVPAPAPAPVVGSVAVSPAQATVNQGLSVQLTAAVLSTSGAPLTDRTVSWTSSDAAIATVSSAGLASAVAHGSATISATVGAVSGSASISVVGRVGSVMVTPTMLTIEEDASASLSAVVRATNGVVLTDRALIWSSADTLIATVSSSGMVTGLLDGRTTVTVRSENQSATVNVTVEGRIAQIAVTPAQASLEEPKTIDLAAEMGARILANRCGGDVHLWPNDSESAPLLGQRSRRSTVPAVVGAGFGGIKRRLRGDVRGTLARLRHYRRGRCRVLGRFPHGLAW